MGDDVLRCEELQQRVQCDFHRAASDEVRRALGLRLEEVDGALVSVATGEPSILFNRTIGLGVGAPASAATVAAIRDVYAGAGIGRYFVHLHPAARPAGLRAWLEEAGLRPARAWTAFERGAKPAPEAGTDLVVAPIAADKAEDFGRIVADAFDMGAAAVPCSPAWRAGRAGGSIWASPMDGLPPPAPCSSMARSAGSASAPRCRPCAAAAASAPCWPGASRTPAASAAACCSPKPERRCRATRSTPTTTSNGPASAPPSAWRTTRRRDAVANAATPSPNAAVPATRLPSKPRLSNWHTACKERGL